MFIAEAAGLDRLLTSLLGADFLALGLSGGFGLFNLFRGLPDDFFRSSDSEQVLFDFLWL
jgi:hypothetical protein